MKPLKSTDPRKPGVVALLKKQNPDASKVTEVTISSDGLTASGNLLSHGAPENPRHYTHLGRVTVSLVGSPMSTPSKMTEAGVSTTKAGEEKFEVFATAKGERTQYDYRLLSGELFTGVFKNVDEARLCRNAWRERIFVDTVKAWVVDADKIVHHDQYSNHVIIDDDRTSPTYIRILAVAPGSRSAYCFIEKATGNIYKPASWRGPVKNVVRGNIYDSTRLAWVGPYGIKSVKR